MAIGFESQNSSLSKMQLAFQWGYQMREITIIALLLAMASGTTLALPLEGSNGNATAVIFASSRVPVEDNATLEILKVDVGLMGAENASYQLLDQDGLVHSAGAAPLPRRRRRV